jgi:hypothetical protein
MVPTFKWGFVRSNLSAIKFVDGEFSNFPQIITHIISELEIRSIY